MHLTVHQHAADESVVEPGVPGSIPSRGGHAGVSMEKEHLLV